MKASILSRTAKLEAQRLAMAEQDHDTAARLVALFDAGRLARLGGEYVAVDGTLSAVAELLNVAAQRRALAQHP